MLIFKRSSNHSRGIPSTLYRRHYRLRHVHFCSKLLQVAHCAELLLMAGLEKSNLHNTKVRHKLWEGCNLQCFCKLSLPPSHGHSVFWGIITAHAVQLPTVNPISVSMLFPKDTITHGCGRAHVHVFLSQQQVLQLFEIFKTRVHFSQASQYK